jgi:anti-sigma factor RsiW
MTPAAGAHCFTDFALEEFVHGRLDPEVRGDLESHLLECTACAQATAMLRVQAAVIVRALHPPAHPAGPSEIDDSTLARYLDRALDPEAVRDLESRLAEAPEALARLVAMYAEVRGVQADAGEGVRSPERSAPAGDILRMPKRNSPPIWVSDTIARLARGLG